MRRRLMALGGTIVALASTAVAVGVGDRATGSTAVDTGARRSHRATAEVTTRDLVEREELDGTLGYGEANDVGLAAQGTLTGLPDTGAVIDRGGVLAEVDGRAIRLLFGTRPLWRQLDETVGDGPDVRQLEENLVALGHATARTLTVDDDWTDATTAAVKGWQKARSVDQNGVVTPGEVVVLPGPARVAGRKATVGSPAGSGPVLAVTGVEKIVLVDLDASRRELLPVGATVEVELPGGAKAEGTVRSVSAVVTPPQDEAKGDKATVEVVVGVTGGAEETFEATPVDVVLTSAKAEDVLTVPVDALLALAEGGYAVEKVTTTGTALVAVEPGAFADGYVQVTGELAAGDEVVVPR